MPDITLTLTHEELEAVREAVRWQRAASLNNAAICRNMVGAKRPDGQVAFPDAGAKADEWMKQFVLLDAVQERMTGI